MAAMDIDSARGKNHAGSPGARDARRKSPRASVGAHGRSSPDAVAEAKAKRAASDAPERRVLFADGALKPAGDADEAALDDFGEDSEDEAEAIMPTQAAPPRDRGSREDRDGDERRGPDARDARDEVVAAEASPIQKEEARRSSFGGFARSVASGLGAVGLGAVAAAFAPAANLRVGVEDSARKKAPSADDARLGEERAKSPPSSPPHVDSDIADSEPEPDSDAEEERELLRDGRAAFFAKVFEETGVRLHDGWRVAFEWSTKRNEHRRRRSASSPRGKQVLGRHQGDRAGGRGASGERRRANPGSGAACPRARLAGSRGVAATAPRQRHDHGAGRGATPTRTPRQSAGRARAERGDSRGRPRGCPRGARVPGGQGPRPRA